MPTFVVDMAANKQRQTKSDKHKEYKAAHVQCASTLELMRGRVAQTALHYVGTAFTGIEVKQHEKYTGNSNYRVDNKHK